MSDEQQLKLECLRLADGDVDKARGMFIWMRANDAEDVLEKACEPWKHGSGDPPEYDSPLDGVFQAGISYAEARLAEVLGVKSYCGCDGTETLDGDVRGTMANILIAAGLHNADGDLLCGDELKAALTPAEDAAVGVVEGEVSALDEFMKLDGAKRWGGCDDFGTYPQGVSDETVVAVITVDGETFEPRNAGSLRWYKMGIGNDIDAYRIISTPAEESDPPPADEGEDLSAGEEIIAGLEAALEFARDDATEQATAAIDQSLSDVEETGGYPHVGGEDEREVGTSELQVVDTWMTPAGDGRADDSDAKMFAYGIQSDEAKKHEAQGWRSLWPLRQKADA